MSEILKYVKIYFSKKRFCYYRFDDFVFSPNLSFWSELEAGRIKFARSSSAVSPDWQQVVEIEESCNERKLYNFGLLNSVWETEQNGYLNWGYGVSFCWRYKYLCVRKDLFVFGLVSITGKARLRRTRHFFWFVIFKFVQKMSGYVGDLSDSQERALKELEAMLPEYNKSNKVWTPEYFFLGIKKQFFSAPFWVRVT